MDARKWTLMFLIAGAGCVQVPSTPSHAPPNVKLTGACIELDDGAKPMPEALAAKVAELVKANRIEPARLLVNRFPDVAMKCGESVHKLMPPTHAERYAEIERELEAVEASRAHSQEKTANAHWQQARTKLLDAYPDPKDILEFKNQFHERFAICYGYQFPCDPNLAERLASARPEIATWPDAESKWLISELTREEILEGTREEPFRGLSCESAFWLTVGHWRLERHEPKGALAALKKAETADTAGVAKPWIQLQQAKAFMQLGQSPMAISVLTGVTGSPSAKLAAMAALGACKFKDGHTEQALVLLKKAIEEWPTPFPCRAESEADLALAYLSVGDEMTGLGHLHSAQRDLQAAGRRPSLWLTLENEARYLRHVGKLDDAAKVEARLAADQAR
jgi:tetratricopeptide (TPR) repeat protein